MKKASWKKKVLYGLGIVFALIQFYPRFSNSGTVEGPNAIHQLVNIPDNINIILKKACFDCHSNFTEKPWYTYFQPIDFWIGDHVEDGKNELNFSEFKKYSLKKQLHKLHEAEEEIEENEMPLSSYTLIHGDAKLNNNEKNDLIAWIKNTMKTLNGGKEVEEKED